MSRTQKLGVLIAVFALVFAAAVPVSAGQPARPFKMHTTGIATFQGGSVDPVTGVSCQHYGSLGTFGFARGTASHLGRVEMETAHCTPLGTESIIGRMSLIAANGDELVLEYEGGPIVDMGAGYLTIEYDIEVIGSESSGRFEDAEGDGLLTVHVSYANWDDPVWQGEFWVKGSIDY